MNGHRLTRFFSRIGTTVALLFAASTAQAGLLSFDDISLDDGSLSSQQYGGFQWDSRWGLGDNSMSMYQSSAVSGSQFLYNPGQTVNLTIQRADPFDFLGAWIGVPESRNRTFAIKFSAFDGNNELLGEISYADLGTTPSFLGAGFSNVSKVVISPRGGLFTLDNFTYQDLAVEVNEAGGFVLLVIGLVGLWAARRRIRGNA